MDNKVPLIEAEKTSEKDIKLDPKGFFIIEIRKGKNVIWVEYYSNVYKKEKIASGNLKKVFQGKTAAAICDTIARNLPDLLPSHYMYLGRELQKAENALEKNKKYVQGGC